jgi:hypothetical protein
MLKTILSAILTVALSTPAWTASYPVSGKWGVSTGSEKGAIDCTGKRVITFNGNQRQDSKGGVPAYRNRTVTPDGPSRYRIVDEFTTGMISNAHATYTLLLVDADHIEMKMQQGGTLKLQRCK